MSYRLPGLTSPLITTWSQNYWIGQRRFGTGKRQGVTFISINDNISNRDQPIRRGKDPLEKGRRTIGKGQVKRDIGKGIRPVLPEFLWPNPLLIATRD